MPRWYSYVVVAALALVSAILGARDGLATDAAPATTHLVVIEAMKFTPSTLEIQAGDQVIFKNSDLVPHTATTKPNQPRSFDSGMLKPGESWSISPTAEEPIHYACTFHPMMEGVIIVKR